MSINELQKLQYGPGKGGGGRTDTDQSAMSGPAFGEMLKAKTLANQGLNFSKHAAKRMNERGISVDNQLMNDLEHAVEGARKKGARDVAIIGPQGVFIVNVPNNTVVTTMSQSDMRERVFTNIDSAVLM